MELFRFRVVRPILAQQSSGLNVATMFDPPLKTDELREAAAGLADRQRDHDISSPLAWLDGFSAELALRGDRVAPDACVALLPNGWQEQVSGDDWTELGHQLALQLVQAAAAAAENASQVEAVCRQLRVLELVTTLAVDARQDAADRVLRTAADVQALVTWRHVILPADLLPPPGRLPLLARRPGFADLYVVRDEWNHYEAGEIAATVNVLSGEKFSKKLRHSTMVDALTSSTTEVTTSQLTEKQQTTSSSLSESSSKDASLNIGAQGQVQTSGQYGPTQVTTSLGAQLQVSQSQADSAASSTAYQTLQRAVNSVTQQVTTVQSQRTVTRDSSVDEHVLQNTRAAVMVGIYRWLNEVHYAQLVRYPHRYILEFQVPEPGAWLKWALRNTSTADWDNPDPGLFRLPGAQQDLSAADITPDDYTTNPAKPGTWRSLAQQWRVRGLTPAPAATVTVAVQVTVNPPSDSDSSGVPRVAMVADESLTVPAGYQAVKWSAQFSAFKNGQTIEFEEAWVTVGGSQQGIGESRLPDGNWDIRLLGSLHDAVDPDTTSFDVGAIDTGTIPVLVYAFEYIDGLTCHVTVTCRRLDETLAQWQEETFDQVASAYQSLLTAYQQERDSRSQQVNGVAGTAGPPAVNQARAVNELRRMVIQDLLGELVTGEADVKVGGDPPLGADEPYVPAEPLADAATIQFFEQAFEWENLTYICYPYYWGRHETWIANVSAVTADPEFDQFLNAGSARVVVPARPGFEDVVLFFLYSGIIWGGTQPPAPDEPGYLSIAQEIEALQRDATDGTPLTPSWSVTLPTALLWAGSDSGTLPANPAPTIPPPGQR
jgi:hypothetical protein